MLSELASIGLNGEAGSPIPVLIRLEPARLERADSPEGVEQLRKAIEAGITRGLRATLTTGNLITGSLYVAIDFYEDAPQVDSREFAGRPVIPSIASGLGGLEQRISALLDKVNDLPLDQTVSELQQTLASLDRLLSSEGMQALPAQLTETLDQLQVTAGSFSDDSELQSRLLPAVSELQHTLSSLRQVLDTLDQQPNALIFNRDYREDPRPPAGTP
jgi:paraquat-inducible protein B